MQQENPETSAAPPPALRIVEQELAALDALEAEALALLVGAEERPLRGLAGLVDWRLCGRLSRVLQSGFFRGERGDSLLLPAGGRLPVRRIFVFGVGAGDEALVRQELARAMRVLERAGVVSVAFAVPGQDAARAVQTARECAANFPGQVVLVVKDAKAAAAALPRPAASEAPVPAPEPPRPPAERPRRHVGAATTSKVYKPRSMAPPKKPGAPLPAKPTPGDDRPPHPTRRKGGR